MASNEPLTATAAYAIAHPNATPFDRAKFRERLAELLGDTIDDPAPFAPVLQPWQRAVLARGAAASRIDEDLFRAVLFSGVEGAPAVRDAWQWFTSHPDVEDAPGVGDRWIVREASRAALLAPKGVLTHAESEALRALGAALAAAYGARGDAWRWDWLSALCLGDPAAAQQWARREFRRVLKRGDFTRALELVRVLEGRQLHLTLLAGDAYASLRGAVETMRREYDAARLFSSDYERTTQLLERAVMRDAWTWVRGGARDARWILNLEAQGGSGKTVFLRWLAARRCLPHGVPYARLDFDFVDARLTATAPWYLIAQLARTLDAQLPGRPFRELVRRADEVVDAGRFALGASDAVQALAQLRSGAAQSLANPLIAEFTQVLREAKLPAVVIVLDTLEVALLEPEADISALLGVLAEVHAACPSLRVILSGRFNLEQRLTGFRTRFGAAVRALALKRLDARESLAYLTEVRGMPNGPVAKAIVARCAGLPFALSLFADEWQIHPQMTVREVREVPGPELHYLVERVLKRIPRPIAWLLRYSVVARRLTRTFLADVIVPELEVLRKGGSYDNPLRDEAMVARYFDDAAGALGTEALSADRLWADLERHASAFSFVSRDEAIEGALKLHEEVVRPLSRELRRHRVLKRLHRAAMKKAEQRAGALVPGHEAAWVAEQREALYHALRLSITDGRRLWMRLLAQVTRAAAHDARRQLANELLDETVDVPAALRVMAAREKAEACIALAEQYDRSYAPEWSEATRAVAAWRALVPASRRTRDGRLAVAEVRVETRLGATRPAAMRRLERLLRGKRTPSERLVVLLTLVKATAGTRASLRRADDALTLLARTPADVPPVTRLRAMLTLTDELLRHGDYARALSVVTQVVTRSAVLSQAEQLQVLAQQAWLASTCGDRLRLARIAARVPAIDAHLAQQAADGTLDESAIIARAILRRELVRGAIEGGPQGPSPFDGGPRSAYAMATDATTDADMAFVEADAIRTLDCIARAREMLPQGESEVIVTLFLGVATVMRDLVGDVRQARSALRSAQSAVVMDGTDAWWNVRLVQCIQDENADVALREMRTRGRRWPSVTSDIMVALAELAVAARLQGANRTRRERAATHALIGALGRITPMRARRRHLFRTFPDVRHIPTDILSRDALYDVLGLDRAPAVDAPDADWVEYLALLRFAHFGHAPLPVLHAVAGVARVACMAGDDPVTAVCDDAAIDAGGAALATGIARYMRASHWSNEGQAGRAIAEAEAALALLGRGDVPPSIWIVRTELLLFRLTRSIDPHAERRLLAAEEVSERLGSAIGGEAIMQARQLAPTLMASAGADASLLTLNLDNVTFDTRVDLWKAVRADWNSATERATPEATVAMLARNTPAALRSCRDLIAPLRTPSSPDGRFVLVANDAARAGLPWELAQAGMPSPMLPGWRSDEEPRTHVNERWLMRALQSLPEPPQGTDMHTVIRDFQQRWQLGATGTLDAATLRHLVRLLRGGRTPRVVLALAGAEYGPAFVMDRMYRGQAIDVHSPISTARGLLSALADQAPDVLHIVAPVVESRSYGGLAFDLGAGSNAKVATGTRYLPMTEVTSVLKRPDSLLRPVVIVHNTLVGLPVREMWRQFTLRNIAAMELARSGSPVAAIAISTGGYIAGDSVLPQLLDTIVGGHPLLAFIDALAARRDADGQPLRPPSRFGTVKVTAEALASFGTVVFANNPAWVAI